MSVRHITAVADLIGVPATCKLVLFGLALEANGAGFAEAPNRVLRRNTGLSERAVRATLHTLEDRKLVTRHGVTGVMFKLTL